MIGVKLGQSIHRGLKVRLNEVRSSDRGFRVDHEIVSEERSTSVGQKVRKFRHVKKEEKRPNRASLGEHHN